VEEEEKEPAKKRRGDLNGGKPTDAFPKSLDLAVR